MPLSTLKLIRHFSASEKYDIHVILPDDNEFADELKKLPVKLYILPFYRFRSPRRLKLFLRSIFNNIPAWIKLVYYLKRHRIQLVHFSDIIDMPFYPAAFFSGAQSIVHLRICIENPALRLIYRWWTFIFSHRVICISEACRQCMGGKHNRARVIYNAGPDPHLFTPRAKYPLHSKVNKRLKAVCTSANIRPDKGHHFFVKMAAFIEKISPGDAHFYMVGGNVQGHEAYYFQLQNLIRELHIEHAVTFLGKVLYNEIPAIISHMDILVFLPKWQEALGGVILEAMAMAKPVVAFDSGGIRECFTNGVSGFLVPHLDVETAAEKVMLLLRDEELRARMGAAARTEVLARFSYEKHFSAVEALYRECLDLER